MRHLCTQSSATTPLGLELADFPRVAEYSNPGLKDESPSGKIISATGYKRDSCGKDCGV